MKLNWGKFIAAAYTLFVVFILFMVYLSFGEDFELVAEDYYAQEIKFQEKIDHRNNAENEEVKPQISIEGQYLKLLIPNVDQHTLKGEVNFFRPSDASMDFTVEFESSNEVKVKLNRFIKGKYLSKISWRINDTEYYHEQNLIIP